MGHAISWTGLDRSARGRFQADLECCVGMMETGFYAMSVHIGIGCPRSSSGCSWRFLRSKVVHSDSSPSVSGSTRPVTRSRSACASRRSRSVKPSLGAVAALQAEASSANQSASFARSFEILGAIIA